MAATTTAIRTRTAAQIAGPGAGFELVEREIPEPGPRKVRIKVACGIVIVTCSQKTVSSLGSSIREFLDTRSWVPSMP